MMKWVNEMRWLQNKWAIVCTKYTTGTGLHFESKQDCCSTLKHILKIVFVNLEYRYFRMETVYILNFPLTVVVSWCSSELQVLPNGTRLP